MSLDKERRGNKVDRGARVLCRRDIVMRDTEKYGEIKRKLLYR